MPEVSSIIRLFVSSTFSDFAFEREVLQRAVFPRLRALCAAQGRRFQPIDLRWGVSEEAGNNKQTLAICLAEIARCQRLSPDLNLLILLGDRYGSCFLPESIPSDQVARLLPHLAPAEQTAFTQAYREDLNALRPEFVLLPSDGSAATKQREESLRQSLVRAAQSAGFSEQNLLPFIASATHLEIQRGLLDADCDPLATICAIRTLDTPPAAQPPQLVALKSAVVQRLGNARVWRYRAQREFTGSQAVEAARKHDSATATPTDSPLRETYTHYDALAEQFYALLEPYIQQALGRRQAAKAASDLTAEANTQFTQTRATVVEGREDELGKIAGYLSSQSPFPLLITGESGVGKSTLLARAVKEATVAHPNAVIVTRFIGVTPETSSLVDLLSGLRREIAERYGLPQPEPVAELSELVAAFARQLETLEASAERPLFLVIDALDQLGSERQRVDWLPPRLAPNVRLVVSILSDREELADLRAWTPEGRGIQLAPLTRAQGAKILRTWLADEGRRLTTEQEMALLDGFAPEPNNRGVPLYLRLAFEQAHTWHSFDSLHPLPPTVPRLIQVYFSELERPARHGRELVAYGLGDLAAAKHGLAEDELLDVLSRSKAVRDGLEQLSPNSPPIEAQLPLPMALWVRLAAELERYLTEREADGTRLVTFYHRQIHDAADRLYLNGIERTARHAGLAAYFAGQPYRLGEGNTRVWNRRKLAEIVFHEALAGDGRQAVETTLTDARFLEGKLTVEGVAAALDDLALAPGDQDIANLARAIRAGTVVLNKEPSELLNQIIGRIGWMPRLHDVPERTTPWLRLRTRSLTPPDLAQLHILQGHTASVNACALSADGHLALSASDDQTLRLWDTSTGQCLRVFTGHSDAVVCCALSADGRRALSAEGKRAGRPFGDHTLHLWDTTTGRRMLALDGHTGKVTDCALSGDGQLALSASEDTTLRLWDTTTGKVLRTFKGHTGSVSACALSADGRLALSSATSDETVRLWETANGQVLRNWTFTAKDKVARDCALNADGHLALAAWSDLLALLSRQQSTAYVLKWPSEQPPQLLWSHTDDITSCTLSAHGHLALFASRDQTLRLWDITSGQCLHIFEGHTGRVNDCALSADGHVALSASSDQTLRLWDTTVRTTSQSSHSLKNHRKVVHGCSLSADGHLAITAAEDDTAFNEDALQLWNTAADLPLKTLQGPFRKAHYCALSADGRLALTDSLDKHKLSPLWNTTTLRLWDCATGETLRVFKGYTSEIRACALSADGRFALSASEDAPLRTWLSTAHDQLLRLWETTTGKLVRTIKIASPHVSGCALSADGRMALSAHLSDTTLRLWDMSNGQTLHKLTGHTNWVTKCALSASGTLALSASWDRTLRLWDTTSGQCVQVMRGHILPVTSCALNADGRLAISASDDQTLRLWDTATGQEIARWTHDDDIRSCAFSADGRIAVAGDSINGVHFLEVQGIGRKETTTTTHPPTSWLAERQPHTSGLMQRPLGKK